ncbi:MAG: deoxyribodipyrimidine photo-lyase [Chlorobiaceae bacterium]|nr:deoxyribodipyrimidine photo-lyase [Chlorobiaceae bacterium]
MDAHHQVDLRRTRRLNAKPDRPGTVVYWMSRDQRSMHNWALLFACMKSNELGRPLEVVFTLAGSFLGASRRHYDFMFKGLAETESALRRLGIPLTVLTGDPGVTLPAYAIEQTGAGAVVTDFSPLRLPRSWKTRVAEALPCALYEVDAHNIVPAWLASTKQEYAARTIRPKLHALAPAFLTPFPEPEARFQPSAIDRPPVHWEQLGGWPRQDPPDGSSDLLLPGQQAGEERLRQFIGQGLEGYAVRRNDPNSGCVSRLSPYLHFGQLSAQHVALSVAGSPAAAENREAFIEELFIRRELADNFCLNNDRYDHLDGMPEWARSTLANHGQDRREHLYTVEQFEHAETHDPLWNAAQTELVRTGLMHGYLRMYWAKKILEWSPSPTSAFEIAIVLNDRYALDGRDPNGYTGIAWSIAGLHDRPWFERPVYGKIRYMNASGCARKFDVVRYIRRMTDLGLAGIGW